MTPFKMPDTIIQVENLGKLYRVGEIGTGTLSHDINRFWARLRGREDPFSKVGTINDRTKRAEKGEHVWALNDINFEVQQGEVLGIIGKNGAGKSTLLKLLSRVTSPTRGEVRIKGRVASLLEVGTGFHPEMTGRENIYMNGTIMGMRRREVRAKLDDIVDFAGVAKYLDTPAKRYSSGMTVRLGFAIAAFLEPEILIVDEVLAVGDAAFQKKAIGKMQEVSSEGGRTVLFVSHNMSAVQQLCTRALCIENGTLAQIGNVRPTIEYYLKGVNRNIGSREWNFESAPGNDKFKLLKIQVAQDGRSTNTVDINKNIQIKIEYDLSVSGKTVVNGINLYSSQGYCVFANCDWNQRHLNKGTYVRKVEIPAYTLAEGSYSVLFQTIILDPWDVAIHQKEILAFDAIEGQDTNSVRGLYKGPWPGVVRIKLNWSKEVLLSHVQED